MDSSNSTPDQSSTPSVSSNTLAEHLNVVALPPPPTYDEAQGSDTHPLNNHPGPHPFEATHRFPAGLFVVRNRSSLKVLDVRAASTQVGAEVIAYTPKRPTLVNGDLLHKENNQLFFLDWHGCLCAANSGLRLDVKNHRLVLSKPQPVLSQPTPFSHPPPQFHYDPLTRTISVTFSHDPTFSGASIQQVNSVDYLLELQPISSSAQPPPSVSALEKLSDWFLPSKHQISSDSESSNPDFLPEFSQDSDDSPLPARIVQVVPIAPGWREKFPSSDAPESVKWLKRQWDIASIVIQPNPASLEPCHIQDTGQEPEGPMSLVTDLGDALGELSTALGGLGSGISRALRRFED
ncbi:hypothetical protein O181_085690 [Austropuccinia psidii MF-1]|uniref:Uncharacterized protein n=1 Tax=Austropuccinia psidii MF-1 TaxID=1389203 RepID=A0A9Q3FY08_9BASI|nr:hypothetical protein [Austropuccinia psidii MF-1]